MRSADRCTPCSRSKTPRALWRAPLRNREAAPRRELESASTVPFLTSRACGRQLFRAATDGRTLETRRRATGAICHRYEWLGMGVCFGSRANLLDESSAAQRLDRSLKGRLQLPLPKFL